MAKDYYAILGLHKGASPDDIKKAYRKMSKELHPDKHASAHSTDSGQAGSAQARKAVEEKFKAVNEAYEVLSDPQKKQMYDQFGEAGVNGQAGAGFGGFNPFGSAQGGQGGGFGGFDFSNFGGNADTFSDLFEGFFGGRSRAAAREQGRDIETELVIDLREVVTGGRREIKVRKLTRCDRCEGSGAEPGSKVTTCGECGGTGQVTRTAQSFFGMMRQTVVCPTCRGGGKVPETACRKCDGEGRVQESAAVAIDIPPGIQDGQSLRLRGQGEAGRRGATAGDLYVHIHVRQDPRFERDGDDVRSAVEIPALDAILGMTIDVETVHGSVSLKIPEGTQPDQVMRIKGKGMPVLNSSRMGDHYVTVKVKVPTKLSREERRLLEEWRKSTS